MSKGKWRRVEWTRERLELMEKMIIEGERTGKYVAWSRHTKSLGHDAHAIRAKVYDVREARKRAKQRALTAPKPATPMPIGIDHRIGTTNTNGLRFAAEMRLRIGTQGITAGLLGDPPVGRSALDKKRAMEAAR